MRIGKGEAMVKIKLDLSKLKALDDEPGGPEVLDVVPINRADSIEGRVFELLNNLTQMQSRFSAHPVLDADATFFERLSHKIKVSDYAKISAHERSISETQRATAENILAVLNEAGMFLRKVEDQSRELAHQQRMREIEHGDGLLGQEERRVNIAKSWQEIEKLKAETELILARAARMKAEVNQIEDPDSRFEREITVSRD